jgi:hypothetical protein
MLSFKDEVRKQLKDEESKDEKDEKTKGGKGSGVQPDKKSKSLADMLDDCIVESLAAEVTTVLGADGAQVKPDFPVLACALENSTLVDKLAEAGVGEAQTAPGADGTSQRFYLFGAPKKHLAQCSDASGKVTCSFLFPGAKEKAIFAKREDVLLVKSNMQDLLPLNKKTLQAVGPGRDHSDDLEVE